MQDRYAGDVGDFGKFSLLKELSRQGLSIGINWYKTKTLDSEKKPDGRIKQNDGGYTKIPEVLKNCDITLAETLSAIAECNDRSISKLEESHLLPNAVYYNEKVPVEGREDWHRQAVSFFKDSHSDLVFLDPDNGLLVPSVKKHQPRSVKYAFYEEVQNYIEQGQSVLVYNHRSRKPELQYFHEIESRLREAIKDPAIFEITFPRFSIRDYFAIPALPDHSEKIEAAFSNMLSGKWTDSKMCQKPLTVGVTYSEYKSRFSSKRDFLRHYQALPEYVVRDMILLDPGNSTMKACMWQLYSA